MASLITHTSFVEHMDKLNNSQDSIQSASMWFQWGRRNARDLVSWWESYFVEADQEKRLCMIYLANDVLQNSRRKGPEFVREFYKVLPRAFRLYLSKAEGKGKEKANHVIQVLEERRVFGSNSSKFRELMNKPEDETLAPSNQRGVEVHTIQNAVGESSMKGDAALFESSQNIPTEAREIVAAFSEANASANHSIQMAASFEVLKPNVESATLEQRSAVASVLRGYIAALEKELVCCQELKRVLQSALQSQLSCEARVASSLQNCMDYLRSLEGPSVHAGNGDDAQDHQSQSDASKMQPEGATGEGGMAAEGNDAEEADALAAQIVSDPSAISMLQEALMAAGGTLSIGNVGQGADQVEKEYYDPENDFR